MLSEYAIQHYKGNFILAISRVIFCLGIVVSIFLLGSQHNEFLLVLFFVLFTFFSVSGGLAAVSFIDIVGKTIPPNKRGTYFGMRMFFGGGLAALSVFLVRITIGAFTLAYPFYILYAQKTLNIKPEAAGIFLSFEMLGYLISNILWAYLSNRINNRTVLLLSAVCSVLPPVIALTNSLFPLPLVLYALAFFFLGATNSGVFIGFFNYLLEIAPEEKRPLYVGFIHTIIFPTYFLSTLGGMIIQLTDYRMFITLTLYLALLSVYLSCRLLKFKK